MHLLPSSSDQSTKHITETPTARRRRRSTGGNISPGHVTVRSKGGNRCSNCNTDNTPLWRKGPDGNTLCNKCGVYWKRHNRDRPIIDRHDQEDLEEEEHTSTPYKRLTVHEEDSSDTSTVIKHSTPIRSPSRKRSLTVKIKLSETSEEGQVEEENVQCKKKKRIEVPKNENFVKEDTKVKHEDKEEEQEGQTKVQDKLKSDDIAADEKPVDMQLELKTPCVSPTVDCSMDQEKSVNSTVVDQYPEIKSLQQQLAAVAIEQQELAGHSSEYHRLKCDCDRLGYICNDALMYCCDPYSQIFLELSPV